MAVGFQSDNIYLQKKGVGAVPVKAAVSLGQFVP